MHRRELLRLLGSAVTLPALAGMSPERLLVLGQGAHARGSPAGSLPAGASELIATMAELILPETDTPGAGTVGVPAFIGLMVADWMKEEERRQFLAGLDQIDQMSRDAGGPSFLALPPAQQVQLMSRLDRSTGAEGSAEGSYATLKSLTVYGYFTSEPIVTRVLKTPMIPGHYDGAAPLHAH